jgi:hypothetical protein
MKLPPPESLTASLVRFTLKIDMYVPCIWFKVGIV